MNRPDPVLLPLEILLERLKGVGISLDPARRLRLLRVLEQEAGGLAGDKEVFKKLKYTLAPVIARTAKEQEHVYTVFEKLEEEWNAEAAQLLAAWEQDLAVNPVEPVIEPETGGGTEKPRVKQLMLLAGAIVLAALGYAVYSLYFKYPALPVVNIITVHNIESGDDDDVVQGFREGKPMIFKLGFPSDGKNRLSGEVDSTHWIVSNETSGEIYLESRGKETRISLPAPAYGTPVKVQLIAWNKSGADTAIAVRPIIFCSQSPVINALFPTGTLEQAAKHTFEAKILKDEEAEWVFQDSGDTLRGAKVSYQFEAAGPVAVMLKVWRKGAKEDCYALRTENLIIGPNKPFLATFPLIKDTPRVTFYLKWFLWLLAALPALLALYFVWRWWKERRAPVPVKSVEQIEQEHPLKHAAPYFIPYLPQEGKITVPRDFFRIAEVLRRREDGSVRNFDIAATIKATIQSGGFPSWRESPLSRQTEYLFIITRPHARHQQGRLFERLASFLRRRDVPLEAFYHDGRFERFWNKDHDALDLAELYRRYPQHRLVLLGGAHELINPFETQMPALRESLLATLKRWPRRLLLTPEPVSGWQFQEALLHRYFLVFPADTNGILSGFDLLDRTEEHDPGKFDRWKTMLGRLHTEPTHRYRAWETVEQHFEYLDAVDAAHAESDKPGFKPTRDWLCALAVSPQPDWALSIAIGRAIGVEVTHDRLLALTRIPWLGANKPDTGLRIQLLSHLSPEDETAARLAFTYELNEVQEQTKAGFAETERRSNLAVQQFALDPFEPAHKKLIGELKKIGFLSGSQLAEVKYIYEARIKPLKQPEEEDVFAWIDKGEPNQRGRVWLALAVGALIYAGLFITWCWSMQVQQNNSLPLKSPEPQTSLFDQKIIDDEALQLNNQAVDIWQKAEHVFTDVRTVVDLNPAAKNAAASALDSIQTFKAQADSLLKRAIALRYNDYPLAEGNQKKLQFNRAAIDFNGYLLKAVNDDSLNHIGRSFLLTPIDTTTQKLDSIALAAMHGYGLCNFYQRDYGQALGSYRDLIRFSDSLYFDTIRTRMPVNLESMLQSIWLLDDAFRGIRVKVLDARSGKAIAGAVVTLLGVNPSLRADDQGRVQQDFGKSVASARIQAIVSAGKYRRLETSFLLRSNKSLVDTVRLIPDDVSAIAALAFMRPSKELLLEAFRDFSFNDSSTVNLDEATRMAQWLGIKDIQTYTSNAEPFVYGNLPSGYSVTIWVGTYGQRDRYGLRFGNPDLKYIPSNDTYLEIQRPGAASVQPVMPTMVRVPGGRLVMGSPEGDKDAENNGSPTHTVTLRDFYMSTTEVTFEAFDAFCNATGREKPEDEGWGRGKRPVINVDWYDAVEYCNWLSVKTGLQPAYALDKNRKDPNNTSTYDEKKWVVQLNPRANGYRLPTEAEWEYAAKGGQAGLKDSYTYAGSNVIDEVAWYDGNANNQSHPVAQKNPNSLSLFDMSGNVWEWCGDWYGDYTAASQNNPVGPDSGAVRVLRGGSWYLNPQDCRVAVRNGFDSSIRLNFIGFRLARTP